MLNFVILQFDIGGINPQFFLFGGMLIVFYLFFIRPQQKKTKDQKKFLEEIKKGSSIVTIGGIHGKITAVEDSTIILEIDKGARIKIEKSSVSMDATKKISDTSSSGKS